jgi:hypothetical protein
MDSALVDYAGVLILGTAVGAGELISVFRDAPSRALLTRPATFFVLVNGTAALAALFLTRVFGWAPGGPTVTSDALRVMQVVLAGLGAMAFFRSSFTILGGQKDFSVSPNVFLERLLSAARTDVDRQRAVAIDTAVGQIMAGVSFAKARTELPSYCFGLMQTASPDDQNEVALQVDELAARTMNDRIKARLLGALLVMAVGEGVLQQAVKSLGADIRDEA